MTPSRIFAATLLLAAPLVADVRERAVTMTSPVTISGVVRDANGNPVAGAIVHSGNFYSYRNGTAPDGKYSLTLPGNRPSLIVVEDFAYEPTSMTFTPTKDAKLDLTVSVPRPAVTVKMTSGETHVLDLGTSTFGYYIPLSGYSRSDNANFCKPDGSTFAPAKTEFAQIIGPATPVNFSACCNRGPVMTVNVKMKSGETTQVYFNDSCFGSEVDFIGRERSTGQYQYFNFANIAQIDFQ